MAPSPLVAALKPNVSAGAEAEQKYQEALSQLNERLDARKNRLFDPTLLAMAQGFLGPTQTGGFGEALGRAAEKVGAAEAAQQKEDIDLAQMRLQVAQGAREQASQLAGQQAFGSIIRGQGQVLNAPTEGGIPSGSPSGAPVAGGAPAQTPQFGEMMPVGYYEALAYAYAYPQQKENARLLMDAAKAGLDRYSMSMNGTVFDKVTKKFLAGPGQTSSEYMVPELGENRTLKMTPNQHDQYQQARDAGLGREWVRNFISPGGSKWTLPSGKPEESLPTKPETGLPTKTEAVLPTKPEPTSLAKPEAVKKPEIETKKDEGLPKPKSAIELEAEREAKIAREREMAKGETQRYEDTINKGNDAGERISQYNRLKATAQKPDANKIFGVFENGKFSDAVFQYLESNNGIISAKNIRDIWTNLDLDPKLISDKQLALSIIAQQQFAFSSLAKGQGAISDFERQLFNAMGADIKDRPDTIIRKMDMLTARAEFDREASRLARAARKEGIGFDEMKDSTKYQDAYQRYVNKLMDIVEGGGRTAPKSVRAPSAPSSPSAPATTAPPSGRPKNPAADKLREELGIRGF